MNITLEMILTKFFNEYPDAHPVQPVSSALMERSMLGIQLLPRHCNALSEEFLYVTDQIYYSAKIQSSVIPASASECIPDTLTDAYITIIFGNAFPANFCKEQSDSIASANSNIILIETTLELADGFNALQKIYNDFIEWGRQLDFAIFRNASFQEFIDLSEQMIASPILIYDPALKLLAYSRMYPGLDDHIFQSAISNGYLNLETVKYFEKEKIFAQIDHTGSAVGEPDAFREHADFARAINIHNELAVYCILLHTSDFPRSYINQIFQIFCNSIEHLLEKQHSNFLRNRSVTDYFLMDLLDNPDTPAEQIRERIYYNDLDYEGNYIVINLYSDIRQKPSENYFIQLLRNNMINCRIFSYRKSIVILYHLPKFQELDYRDYLRSQLQSILKDFNDRSITMYISKPFTTIGQFSSAYQQTENLYQIFDRQNQEIFCFYEDHWLKNLIYSLPQKDKTFSFCDPCILQMLHSGTKKSRQQLEILYEYLRCDRKLTDVAHKLGMHRNNVIYHIKQIEEKWHLNLDNPDARLQLLISFEIINSER